MIWGYPRWRIGVLYTLSHPQIFENACIAYRQIGFWIISRYSWLLYKRGTYGIQNRQITTPKEPLNSIITGSLYNN